MPFGRALDRGGVSQGPGLRAARPLALEVREQLVGPHGAALHRRVNLVVAAWDELADLGDVGEALQRADPAKLEDLYRPLGLEMIYRSAERLVEVTVQPRVVRERVRGGLAH